jgi:hypothetical protein
MKLFTLTCAPRMSEGGNVVNGAIACPRTRHEKMSKDGLGNLAENSAKGGELSRTRQCCLSGIGHGRIGKKLQPGPLRARRRFQQRQSPECAVREKGLPGDALFETQFFGEFPEAMDMEIRFKFPWIEYFPGVTLHPSSAQPAGLCANHVKRIA